jgi:UDP-N-acetylmuramoyl-L-alanyl-D-glutamate--2,6-diaminopimelate ligase
VSTEPRPLAAIVGALERAALLQSTRGELPTSISGITDDSRAVRSGTLFVAIRGSARDGHEFLGAAASGGASVAIVEDADTTTLPSLVVSNGRRAAAVAAAAYYREPAESLSLFAVTGTNGKTTTVNLLRHLLDVNEGSSASIGTLGILVGSEGTTFPGGQGLTTPGPVELQRVLRGLVDAGVRNVAMEVSSHSLEQRRVEGLKFQVGTFTSFSRDHLDYHGTMESYFAAKAMLVDFIAPGGHAVVNADEAAWGALPGGRQRTTFSTQASADVSVRNAEFAPTGSRFILVIDGADFAVSLPLIGDFNVSNAAAAAATAWRAGVSPVVIARRLSSVPQVPGRLEIINEQPTVLRDYAHTPDALERSIAAVRPFATGKLMVVFGCGGDRDRGKRPEMGRIAEQGADVVFVTSDNPRTEDPGRILDDIEAGMQQRTHVRIEDRREAIAAALTQAGDDDVILLAGKGHETYQIRGTETLPFDEREIVRELLRSTAR